MNKLFDPLNDDEFDQIDRLLLDRIDEDADTEGKDEGVLCISELDGFFTAVVSGPVTILPSRWLPAIWGDFTPVWENVKAFEEVISLLMRHMNDIAAMLMDQPEDFEPLFLQRTVEDETIIIVDEWCEGYMRGVALAADQWEAGGLQMKVLLAPIRAFASETGWQAHAMSNDSEKSTIRNAITPNVREIHAWWLARREGLAPVSAPVRHEAPRIGRNDPCPCGSGKKYKRCCLH